MGKNNGTLLGIIGLTALVLGIIVFVLSTEVSAYFELALAIVSFISFTLARITKSNIALIIGQYVSLLYVLFALYLLWFSLSWK
jgi:hypothetical protein